MSWETRLVTTMSFNRKTYDCLGTVENDLEEVQDMIKYFKNKIISLAMITEPKKFCEEDQDPLCWLQHETEECLNELETLYTEEYKLLCLKDNWETCHTKEGEPIHPPKEFCNGEYGDCAYIDGDFILTNAEKQEYNG
jgi:hypothetical protein